MPSRHRSLALCAVALVAVAGCDARQDAGAPTSTAQQPITDVAPPLVPAMALPDNAVDNAVGQLDRIASELMESSGVPGMAVAVVHGGETVYAKGFGVKDARLGEDDPANQVDADTVFQLASLSKPLGATVVAHQITLNTVSWDTPVVSELPWFALSDPAVTQMVTVGDMYSHRSGLPDQAGDLLEDLGYDRRYVLEHLRELPLGQFRTSYEYTNFGLTAAAEAVAVNAGKTWEDLSQDVLYGPLGMTSTSSRLSDFESRSNRALTHIRIDGGYQPLYVRDPDPQAPAGGVSSSINDLTRWLAMMLGNGTIDGTTIASPESLLPALSPQIVASPGSDPAARPGYYGYGFDVNTTSAARMTQSHSGAFELGAATNFVIIPSADVAIVALTNGSPTGIPETLTAEFADLVQFGEVREDWRTLFGDAFAQMGAPVGSLAGKQPPANPAAAKPLESYIGTYANDYWGPAAVTDEGGTLVLRMGPRGEPWPLEHWDGDTFKLSFVAENSSPGSASTATFDGDRLTLEYYDEDEMGTFTR